MTPTGTSNELDVQNECEENTHTHTHGQRSQQQSGQITLLTVLINKPKFLTSCGNKEHDNTVVSGGGGLELVKPARKPVPSHPNRCAYVKNAPRILPVFRSFLAPRKKKTDRGQRSVFPSETPLFAPLILALKGSALP